MRPVELLAFLVAAFGMIKLIVVMTQPQGWISFVKKFYAYPRLTMAVSLLAALIILKILLVELTIVQIFAAMAFMMALIATGLAAFAKEILDFSQTILKKKNFLSRAWPLVSAWTVLIIWVLVVIFR